MAGFTLNAISSSTRGCIQSLIKVPALVSDIVDVSQPFVWQQTIIPPGAARILVPERGDGSFHLTFYIAALYVKSSAARREEHHSHIISECSQAPVMAWQEYKISPKTTLCFPPWRDYLTE